MKRLYVAINVNLDDQEIAEAHLEHTENPEDKNIFELLIRNQKDLFSLLINSIEAPEGWTDPAPYLWPAYDGQYGHYRERSTQIPSLEQLASSEVQVTPRVYGQYLLDEAKKKTRYSW